MSTTYELQLKHLGGETRTVRVIGRTGRKLIIVWGMAGLYNFQLTNNRLERAVCWSATDIQQAWTIWRMFEPRVQPDIVKCVNCRGLIGHCKVCKKSA